MSRATKELLARSRAGQAHAFGHLVERYWAQVRAAAFRATGDLALSEDLAQEAFVRAWKRLDDLREPARFGSWVSGIARNLARESRRHQRRHAPGSGAGHIEVEVPCAGPSPLEQAIARQTCELVREAIARVPASYREPLLLFYREYQTIEQVATRLGLSQACVKQRLCRGRKYLARSIESLLDRAPAPSAAVAIAIAAGGKKTAAAGSLATAPAGYAAPAATGPAATGLGSKAALLARPAIMGWTAAAAMAVVAVAALSTGPLSTRPPGPLPAAKAERSAPDVRAIVDLGPGEITRVEDTVEPATPARQAPARSAPERPARPSPRGIVELGEPELEPIRRSSSGAASGAASEPASRARAMPSLEPGEFGDMAGARPPWEDRSPDELAPDELAPDELAPDELPVDPPDLRARVAQAGAELSL